MFCPASLHFSCIYSFACRNNYFLKIYRTVHLIVILSLEVVCSLVTMAKSLFVKSQLIHHLHTYVLKRPLRSSFTSKCPKWTEIYFPKIPKNRVIQLFSQALFRFVADVQIQLNLTSLNKMWHTKLSKFDYKPQSYISTHYATI